MLKKYRFDCYWFDVKQGDKIAKRAQSARLVLGGK